MLQVNTAVHIEIPYGHEVLDELFEWGVEGDFLLEKYGVFFLAKNTQPDYGHYDLYLIVDVNKANTLLNKEHIKHILAE